MTVPGGVTSLPPGALTADNMASQLQDMTPDAMQARAAERVPATYNGSTGGNPATDLTPMGFITRLFAGFVSHVANADPADIQSPDDLPNLLNDFIHDLPVVGEFVRLLDALAGTYVGDDPALLQIQALFGGVRGGLDKLRQFIESLIGGHLDLTSLPSPEQAWQQVTSTFLNPAWWLGGIPVGAISSGVPNLLAELIADGVDGWVVDDAVHAPGDAASFRITADGSLLELFSERIALDVGRTVDAVVKVKYSGLAAAAGTSPLRLSWTGWAGDNEVAGGDFEVHQPAGPDHDWLILAGSLTRLDTDAWDSVSIRLTVTAGASAGTVWWSGWRATKPDRLPQNLVDGLVSALDAARQTIRDLICNALGYAGTGKTDAEVIYALTNIPQAAVAGLTTIAGNLTAIAKNFFDGWFGGNHGTGTPAEVRQAVEAIKVAIQGGYTLQTFTANNPAWTLPAGLILTDVTGVVINAGQCGSYGGDNYIGSSPGGIGGRGGSYSAKKLDLTGLTPGVSTLAIDVGAGGSTSGALGGTSRIKSGSTVLLEGAAGTGGVASVDGWMATTSTAGDGGDGGATLFTGGSPPSVTVTQPADGRSSAVGVGGTRGVSSVNNNPGTTTGGPGADGGPGSATTVPLCGGGGGGGGGAAGSTTSLNQVYSGAGGNGGYPGGAGGGSGGLTHSGNRGGMGSFGLGAHGLVALIYKTT